MLGVVGCLLGCVSPYDVRYDLNANVVTVEGFVTDESGATVILKRSISQNVSSYDVPLKGCTAAIRTGNGSDVALAETSEGIYVTPADFKGQAGQTYQLRFKTKEGQSYESSLEKMIAVPDIKKVYQQYDPKGLLNNEGTKVLAATTNIFIDFDDPAADRNFYLWRWTLWERQSICITCEQGIYLYDPAGGECLRVFSNPAAPTYDYVCNKNCWEILRSKDLNVFSDGYSNGRAVVGRSIAKIPLYSRLGALIEIEQLGLGPAAYEYYELLRNQTQTTGTLTDTPPAPIIGNIRNSNDLQEKVVGYFGAATVKKVRYWIDRSSYTDAQLTSLLGREPNLEPASPFRPPSAPCLPSRNRTPFTPQGWRQ